MNITKELSDSLLAACRMANITEPKYIAQDADGSVCHYGFQPKKLGSIGMWADYDASGTCVRFLNHPPYADYWRDSLIEWVEPQEMLPTVFIPHDDEPLADVLARHGEHVADDSKMVSDDARKLGYRKMIAEYAGRRTEAQVYEIAWRDALAWKAMAEKGGEKL